MIRYSIDSTLTLREVPVFRNGARGVSDYDRKNSSADGFTLSNSAKRKIKQYISGYFLENDHLGKNISWVTLTVPPRIDGFNYQEWCDDQPIIKQFSKFLENLRKNHGLKNYVWVAERQDGKRNDYRHCTGAIHFHCLFDFDEYVSYSNLNLYWVKLLNELGYKAFSSTALLDKMKSFYFSIEKTYERYRKTLFSDIAKGLMSLPEYRAIVKKVCDRELEQCLKIVERQNFRDALQGIDPMTLNSDHPFCKIAYQPYEGEKLEILDFSMLQTYLTKYVTKNETKIHGRVWGASRGFSSIDYELVISAKQAQQLKEVQDIILCENEKSFEIGNNKFTTKTTKLDYKKFASTPVYLDLMSHIYEQRMNPEPPQLPDFPEFNDLMKHMNETFELVLNRSFYPNSECRMETLYFPASVMPIYTPPDNDVIFQSDSSVQMELFDFVDRDKKLFK